MSIEFDVGILTYNDMDVILYLLSSIDFIDRINRLVVVDGGSKDFTLDIIKLWASENDVDLKIIENIRGRGRARKILFQELETEYAVILDSDIVLSPGWLDHIITHINEYVGMIWGAAYTVSGRFNKILRIVEEELTIDRLNNSYTFPRFYTHDILVKTELLKDLDDLEKFHTFEDHRIALHILNKGYRVVKCLQAYAFHLERKRSWLKDFYRNGFDGYRIRFYSPKHVVKLLVGGPIRGLYWSLLEDIKFGMSQTMYYLVESLGILRGMVYGKMV